MPIRRARLDNGLTVLTEEMHAAPVVALQAWVNVGSADEEPELAGVAHLHEHMLFKGTARRGVGEIARTVESAGGEINAWTSFDQTVYHLVMAASETGTGIDILADALRESAFDSGEMAREIEVVIEEIRRAQDTPSRRVSNALFDTAYVRHPYRRPVLGTVETVRALTRERVVGFYKKHYRPDRITIVAVGDFDHDALVKLVERSFGNWHAGPAAPLADRAAEPPQNEARARLLVEDVREARLAVAWHVPGLRHEDVAAVDALSMILGHGEGSRLFVEVRRRRELVNDTYAYAYTPREPGLIMVGAGLKADGSRAALGAILDQVYATRHRRVREDELERAKVLILSESAYQKETVQGEARKIGFYEVVAGDWRFEDAYRERLKALTVDDIREAARRYFTDAPTLVLQTHDATVSPDVTALADIARERFAGSEGRRAKLPARGALDVSRIELPSGGVLLVKEEPSPVMAVRSVGLGGQRYESRERSGIGNLFSCIWGQATTELTPEAMAQRMADLGGALSAFSGRNVTGMRAEFIAERAREGLQLFADALLSPRFTAQDLDRERAVVLERIKSRLDSPGSVAFDLFAETLFPGHPYGLSGLGTPESLRALTLDEVVAHGSRFVTPDKLVIGVVGPLSAAAVMDLLGERLEAHAGERVALAAPPPLQGRPSAPARARRKLDKQQCHVVVGSLGTTVAHADRFPLEVLTTILSGQSGRLFLDLRDRQSLAYSVSSSNVEGLDPGHVLVHMGTSPEKVERGLAGIYGHLARLRDEPISAEELERARRYLAGTNAIDLQRCGARAMLMALGELYRLGYDDYTRYADRIAQVTVEDLQRVARTYFAAEGLIEVVVGPVD